MKDECNETRHSLPSTLIILLFASSPSSRFASHMMMTVGKTMRSGETWSRSLVTAVSLLTNGLTVSTFTISSSLIVSSPPEGRRRRGDVRSRDEGGPVPTLRGECNGNEGYGRRFIPPHKREEKGKGNEPPPLVPYSLLSILLSGREAGNPALRANLTDPEERRMKGDKEVTTLWTEFTRLWSLSLRFASLAPCHLHAPWFLVSFTSFSHLVTA